MVLYNPKNLDLDSIFHNICHPDYARMYINTILSTAYKLRAKELDFIPLHARTLRKQVHAKKTELIKKTLIDHGIIECDNMYCPKLKCFGYRLSEKYRCKVIPVNITKRSLLKKIVTKEPELIKRQHKSIWKWLNLVKIDYQKANALLTNTANITQKSMALEKLYARDFFFVEDERGRVYHNVACLWSKFRKLLSINGTSLQNVDIKNSQPLIFSLLLREYYQYYISTKSGAPFLSDMKLFVDHAEHGSLYDFLMSELDIDSKKRNYFKKKFFAEVFYAKTGVETNLSKKFNSLFPNVAKAISFYKMDDYRNLPLEMQRMEAELMIGKVSLFLADLDVPFLTVHDSILTLPEYVEDVKLIIRNVFNECGLNPTFGQ